MGMKNTLFIGAIALALCTCAYVDGLPEPELPVKHIAFSSAVFHITDINAPNPNGDGTTIPVTQNTLSISIDVANTDFNLGDYTGIFSFYNKTPFDMKLHLKEGGGNIKTTTWSPSEITVRLEDGSITSPAKLVFDTNAPLYLYKTVAGIWNQVVEAKAIITTPELAVVVVGP